MLQKQKDYFKTNQTKSYKFKIEMLKKLKFTVLKNESLILEALNKDLNKSFEEGYLTEILPLLNEINFFLKNLKKLTKRINVKSNLLTFKSKSYLYSEPLGNVLILAPWNYPFLLSLSPLVGSIAGGNTTIIKPSEVSNHTSLVIAKIIKESFRSEYIHVALGGSELANELTNMPFDKIFFTGSTSVGKKVLANAAKNLIPVTLELGGKSPVIFLDDINLEKQVKKLVFGKLINAGQTCIAPDYLLIKETMLSEFLKYFKYYVSEFYADTLTNNKYPKIINEHHFKRLLSYLNNNKVLLGGNYDNNLLKIEPTCLLFNDLKDMIPDEIFGPILPIITYHDISDLFKKLNLEKKPLTIYLFTNNKNIKKTFLNNYSSGSLVINDTISQFVNHYLPFGGVGSSGMGKYHGKSSFECFTHQKSVLEKSNLIDISLRYPPYHKEKFKKIKRFIK